MATYEKEGKDIQAEGEQEHKIRITITSKNCSAIERISNELVKAARDKNLKVKVRLRKTYFFEGIFLDVKFFDFLVGFRRPSSLNQFIISGSSPYANQDFENYHP